MCNPALRLPYTNKFDFDFDLIITLTIRETLT